MQGFEKHTVIAFIFKSQFKILLFCVWAVRNDICFLWVSKWHRNSCFGVCFLPPPAPPYRDWSRGFCLPRLSWICASLSWSFIPNFEFKHLRTSGVKNGAFLHFLLWWHWSGCQKENSPKPKERPKMENKMACIDFIRSRNNKHAFYLYK